MEAINQCSRCNQPNDRGRRASICTSCAGQALQKRRERDRCRRDAMHDAGKCKCGRPAKPGRVSCQHCIDAASQARQRTWHDRASRHVCPECETPAMPPMVRCRACCLKHLQQGDPERATEFYLARIAAGLCYLCGLSADGYGIYCHGCAEERASAKREVYLVKKEDRLLAEHGATANLE